MWLSKIENIVTYKYRNEVHHLVSKDLPCYCYYRYLWGSICVGCEVGKVRERKGLR